MGGANFSSGHSIGDFDFSISLGVNMISPIGRLYRTIALSCRGVRVIFDCLGAVMTSCEPVNSSHVESRASSMLVCAASRPFREGLRSRFALFFEDSDVSSSLSIEDDTGGIEELRLLFFGVDVFESVSRPRRTLFDASMSSSSAAMVKRFSINW